MPVVRAASLSDGMVLARDATDARGRLVAPAGTTITQDVRTRLFRARVQAVEVRDQAAEPGAPVSAGQKENEKGKGNSDSVIIQGHLVKIAHMFNDYRDDPLMRELCRLAIKCAKERLLRA